jgi:hypothetical protein
MQALSVTGILSLILVRTLALAEEDELRISLMAAIGAGGARVASNTSAQAPGLESNRALSWGGGLFMEKPISTHVGIELGAIYLARKFEVRNPSITFQRTVPTLIAPLEVRSWINDMFSVAGGFFAATRTNDQRDETTAASTAPASFSGGARKRFEFGFTAATAINQLRSRRPVFLQNLDTIGGSPTLRWMPHTKSASTIFSCS